MPPLPLLLLLPCLLQYFTLPYSSAADVQMAPGLPVTNTSCTKCAKIPEVTKCTYCEGPIRAKSKINPECKGTLTCATGRILIANSRYVVRDVKCTDWSSDEEQVWSGKTSDEHIIAIENAACFITPISCISLGSFSTRCPRGFICDKVSMNMDQSRVWCHKPGWWHKFIGWLNLNVDRKNLWFRNRNDTWEPLKEELFCDPKLGAWRETDPVNSIGIPRSIITERLICGKKEFKLFNTLLIDQWHAKFCVLIIQICVPILLVASKYLDEQYTEGKEKAKQIKETEKLKVRMLIDRWKTVNSFVVEKNKPTVIAYMKKGKGRKKE